MITILFCFIFTAVLSQQKFSVKEEKTPGYVVGTIANYISDARYCLTEDCGWSDYFRLDESTGVIATAKVIDREALSDPLFVLLLRGTYNSNGSQFQLYVEILVEDINDNPPSFAADEQIIQIAEENGAISFDLLSWYDEDSGKNGRLKNAEIFKGNIEWPFECVLSSTGVHQVVVLKVLESLDYEERHEYNLTIRIQDDGAVPLEGFLNVSIQVQDQNDHTPKFNKSAFTFTSPENRKTPFTLGIVVASDRDSGANGKITYSISKAGTPSFSVDPSTGRIIMTQELDYETAPYLKSGKVGYSMVLVARDNGASPRFSTTVVTVELKDENDNTPSISFHSPNMTGPDTMEIYENIQINSYAATIIIHDSDSGINAQCSVHIDRGDFGDFKLESSNGHLVITADKIDREKHAFYNMTISVTDHGVPRLKSEKSLYINVIDLNDNAPKFPKPVYNINVNEDIVINKAIANVSAHDVDSGKNAEIKYSIVSQGSDKAFTISSAGMISNIKYLDAEATPVHVLNVSAEDGGTPSLRSYTTVNIKVADINDNDPKFKKPFYTCSIAESVAVGSRVCSVEADDKDSGANGKIKYTISGSNDFFKINTDTGEISLNLNLDYESEILHKFVVRAEDGGTKRRHATCEVVIKVTDVNDEPPHFDKNSYIVNLPADVKPNEIVQVSASDRDEGDVVNFNLSVPGDGFKIHSSTGIITLDKRLAYSPTPIILEAIATDTAGNTSPTPAKITVYILRNTPTLPVFTKALTLLNLEENKDPGTVVILTANTSSPCSITYSLQSQNYFNIDTHTGNLRNTVPIDYEKNKLFELDIEGSCKGTIGFAKVVVSIEDVNDNSPSCEDVPTITVSEGLSNKTLIYSMICSDEDTGKNADLYYSHTSPYFSINKATGDVFLEKELDREEKHIHQLIVKVCDKGIPENCIDSIINVIVSDINDNTPQISEPFTFTVREDVQPNHEVAKITAEDPDAGNNSKLTFSLLNPVTDLKLFGSGEIITENKLDYERNNKYFLNVKVSDGGDPSLDSIKMIEVTVLDVNDNAPKFSSDLYKMEVEEQVTVPRLLGHVSATDADSGKNKEIAYSLLPSLDYLDINSTTGALKLIKSLDFEKNRNGLTATVVATDNGTPSLKSTTEIFINVTDINDNYPEFESRGYSAQVSESDAVGHHVITVSARDNDGPRFNKIRYRLDSEVFRIESASGKILTTQKLDFEAKQKYEVTVTAEDNGSPPLSSSVILEVFVEDVNDNPPSFQGLITDISVVESTTPGTVIQTLLAVDPDSGNNGKVSYFVTSQVPSGYFRVDEITGKLELTQKLIFNNNQKVYDLTVKAEDHGSPSKSTTKQLTVTVIDVNDNKPVFTDGITHFELQENADINSVIFSVTATDADSNSAGIVRFSLYSSYFTVDRVTGEVIVIAVIDREKLSSFILEICATDQAQPVTSQLSTCKNITITIIDANDNSPVFIDQTDRINVRENWKLNSVITVINVTDADEGRNGIVRFDLSSQTPGKCVTIDAETGALKPCRNYDYELEKVTCSFTVKAYDLGESPLYSEKTFELVVQDVNDNLPTFLNPPLQRIVYLNGDVPKNSIMYKAIVKDLDSGKNGDVVFTLASDNFKIGYLTGIITNNNDIGSSFRDQSLIVQAMDQGDPPLDSTMTVSIKYKVGNSKPICPTAVYNISVREDISVRTPIVRLSCYDLDWGRLGSLKYAIIDGDTGYNFGVDANGEIFSVNALDYETVRVYNLTVLVSDSAVPSLQTLTKIRISLENINDNPPSFDTIEEFVKIRELTPLNTTVLVLDAVDPDLDVITYTIDNVDAHCSPYFELQGANLTLVKGPIFEDLNNCVMSLAAHDTVHTVHKKIKFIFIDEDNSEPQFYSSPKFTVSSTSIVVGVVGALDADYSDWDLSYGFGTNKRASQYYINATTGLIRCPTANCPTTTLRVRASGSNLASENDVTITMSGSPSPGMFSQLQYTFSVSENDAVGTEAGLLGIHSKPDTLNIEGGNLGRTFSVFNNGSIFVNGRLDREQKETFILIIVGTLKSLSEFATVRINVLDVNDNSPVFDPTDKVIVIDEFVNKSDIIGTVTAVDDDDITKPNGKIQYNLKTPSENFNIDQSTGQISVEKLSQSSRYTLYVVANDMGTPPLRSNTLRVHVKVHRVVPEPTIQIPKMKIYASSPPNSIVDKISAVAASEDYYLFSLSKPNPWIRVYSSGYILQKGPVTDSSLASVETQIIATSLRNSSIYTKVQLSIPIIKSICEPNPCLNGGSCEDLVKDYLCFCAVGSAGKNCECLDSNCTNGGVCFYHESNQTTNCLCEDGTFRVKCSTGAEKPVLLIASVVGGTVVFIALLLVMVIFCINKRKKKQKKKDMANVDFNKAINEVPITTSKRLKGQLHLQDTICLNPINVADLNRRPPINQFSYTNHEYDANSPTAMEVLAPTPRSLRSLQYPESDSGRSSNCADAVIFRKLYDHQPTEEGFRRRDKDSGLAGSLNTLCHYDVDVNNRDTIQYNQNIDNINYLNDWRPHVQNIMNCLSLDDIDVDGDAPIKEEFV